METILLSEPLLNAIKSLPEKDQSILLEQVTNIFTFGLRAVVLEGLQEKDLENFEQVLLRGDTNEMLTFGSNHVEHFNEKISDVIKEISESLEVDLGLNTTTYAGTN